MPPPAIRFLIRTRPWPAAAAGSGKIIRSFADHKVLLMRSQRLLRRCLRLQGSGGVGKFALRQLGGV